MTQGDWCERLTDAITDGRFVEDAAFWKPHVAECATCRRAVEGLFDLRELVENARLEAPVVQRTSAETKRMLDEVVRRYAAERRATRTALCVVVAVALGAAAWVGWSARGTSTEVARTDPASYALSLYRRVYPVDGQPHHEILREDAGLRAEYLAALHHESPLVRRTALALLVGAKAEIPVERLAAALDDWKGSLHRPIEVATTGDAGALLEQALETQRDETVSSALTSAAQQALHGRAAVPSPTLLPYLADRDANVRRLALDALAADASFAPGAEVERVLREDPDASVRVQAARALWKRRGAEGATLVLEHVRDGRDLAVEERALPHLQALPAAAEFSRRRAASEDVPVALRLLHAVYALRSGTREPPVDLLETAFERWDVATGERLVALVAEGDWTEYRPALQSRWRTSPSPERLGIGAGLAHWDVRSGEESRLGLTLEILETDRDPALRDLAVEITKSPFASVRARARTLVDHWPLR